MGGIVAAETLLLLANDHVISGPSASTPADSSTMKSAKDSAASKSEQPSVRSSPDPESPETTSLLFPRIRGILAFDTPFLGISPGVIAHGAEDQYKSMSSAYKAISGVSSAFGWQGQGISKSPSTSTAKIHEDKAPRALPAAENQADAAAIPKWQSWGKYAMYAGAAGAIAAGGAAALYSQKDKLNLGWTWVSDHLVFVGCLLRAEDLKQRLRRAGQIASSQSIGLANMYTVLGKGALQVSETSEESNPEKNRTFTRLPPGKVEDGQVEIDTDGLRWTMARNNKAKDEISAHVSMFYPRDNPGYYNLGQTAKALVLQWIDGKWYEESKNHADDRFRDKTNGEFHDDEWEEPTWELEAVEKKESRKSAESQGQWVDATCKESCSVRMRDEITDENKSEDLESSVIVDKAS